MTRRRQKVLERYIDASTNGERISLARMARECGLNSYRDARRTLRDLERLGAIG